jgi:hypothetical protein
MKIFFDICTYELLLTNFRLRYKNESEFDKKK